MITIEQLQKIAFETVNDPKRAQIQPDKTFLENGIDSLDTMTLLLNIEESTGIKFTEKEVEEI
jgi:acyl carrier protein